VNCNPQMIGDFANVVSGFAFKSEDFVDQGIPIIKIANIQHENVVFDKVQYLPLIFQSIPDRYHVKSGDVMISLTGSHVSQPNSVVGRVARYRHDFPALLNQRAARIVIRDSQSLDQGFLYYFLRQEKITYQLAINASGSANQANISPRDVESVQLPCFSFRAQQRIAAILSAYDDLIENNRRRIALLEEAARQLYKEWFVRFRFPGHEHVKMLDSVPEGWSIKAIDDVCQTIGGGTPSTAKREYWNDGDIQWFTPTDVTRNSCLALLSSETNITESGLNKSSAKMIPAGSILMTSRASVGFFGINRLAASTNQGFINIVPNDPSFRMYLLQNFMFRVEEIRSHAGGATYKEISKGRFRAMSILAPPSNLALEFEEQASLIHRQVETLHIANKQLAKARDLLLPRLMNGSLAV
jgi:type I restriction enzyme, S subunit